MNVNRFKVCVCVREEEEGRAIVKYSEKVKCR